GPVRRRVSPGGNDPGHPVHLVDRGGAQQPPGPDPGEPRGHRGTLRPRRPARRDPRPGVVAAHPGLSRGGDGARQSDRVRRDVGGADRDDRLPHEEAREPAMTIGSGNPMPRGTLWVLAINVAALIAFASGPAAVEYPLAAAGILAVLFAQLGLPACRIQTAAPLCPANIAQGYYWIQLVLVTVLVGHFGFSQGV